ncbi:MAG TPA: TIGR03668 family PPOX class F420-dependent oxidoreductase [Chloroflexota bacterium]
MGARHQLTKDERKFVERMRVARLATADARGIPHAVPVCYAFDGHRFYTPLDEKSKRVPDAAMKRVRNIAENSAVAFLVDRYDDDWSQLAYVLVQGQAELIDAGREGHADAVALLRARYPQYREMHLEIRPVIAIRPERVVSWGLLVESDQSGSRL